MGDNNPPCADTIAVVRGVGNTPDQDLDRDSVPSTRCDEKYNAERAFVAKRWTIPLSVRTTILNVLVGS